MASRVYADPDWPAAMSRAIAARYCGMTPAEFEREVLMGNLPDPITAFCSGPRWLRSSIDAALARLAGGDAGSDDWRGECKLYASQ